MMKIGSTTVTAVYLGSVKVPEAYLGSGGYTPTTTTTAAPSSSDYTEVTLSGFSPSSFNTTYDRQSTGFVLDNGTVSSGNSQFNPDSNYYYYVARSGSFNTGRIVIWSVVDNSWMVLLSIGADYTEGNVSDNQGVGVAAGETTVTGSSETGDGRNVPQSGSGITYPAS